MVPTGEHAEARLAVSVKDHAALQFAAGAAMARDDLDTVVKYVTRSRQAPYMQPVPDKVLQAWNGILADKVSDEMVADLDTGNLYSGLDEGPGYAYTLALTQLFNGKPGDCKRSLSIALKMDQTDSSGLAWLVQGELMKHYSLEHAATSAFEHARSSGGLKELDFARLLMRN